MIKLPSSPKNTWGRWIPGVVISLIIIGVLLRLVDTEAVFAALKRTNYLYVLLAICLLALANLTRAAAWRELLGRKIKLSDAFYIVNDGYVLNQIIPRSGEIGRAILVNSVIELNFFQALSTILIERALDLFFAAILFLATIGKVLAMDWIIPVAITILCVVLVGFIFLFWAIKKRSVVENWCSRMEEKSKFFKKNISHNLLAILEGAEIIQDRKHFLYAVLWILFSWVLWITITYVLLVSFIGVKPIWWAVFIQSVLAFGIALPSAPAGLGVYEGTLVAALAVFDVQKEIALSYAIIMHVVQLLTIAVLGTISLTVQGNSLRSLVERVLERRRTRRSEDDN